MEIAGYRSQDTKAWPGKISLVIEVGSGKHSLREMETELQKSFTTTAVVFEGYIEQQGDLAIAAKKMKLKGRLVRINIKGTKPSQLKTLIDRRVVDYVSLWLKAPLYKESYGDDFEKVRESVQLLGASKVEHEIVLDWGGLSDGDVKDAASQVTGTFVLFGDRAFDELREKALELTGPKHIRIRNSGGEQSIN